MRGAWHSTRSTFGLSGGSFMLFSTLVIVCPFSWAIRTLIYLSFFRASDALICLNVTFLLIFLVGLSSSFSFYYFSESIESFPYGFWTFCTERGCFSVIFQWVWHPDKKGTLSCSGFLRNDSPSHYKAPPSVRIYWSSGSSNSDLGQNAQALSIRNVWTSHLPAVIAGFLLRHAASVGNSNAGSNLRKGHTARHSPLESRSRF